LKRLQQFQEQNKTQSEAALQRVRDVAIADGNVFEALVDAAQYCSLGQLTQALFDVGGQYRRSM